MLEGLYQLEKQHTGELAGVLARAFQDDPMFAYMFPDPDDRSKALPVIMGSIAGMSIVSKGAYAPSAAVEGCLLVSGPGKARMSPAMIAAAVRSLPLPFRVTRRTGIGPLLRRGWAIRNSVAELRECKQALGKCLHIDMIAVDGPHRGTKLMSRMMRAALAAADKAGVKCVLDTESEANVAIYSHFGFSMHRRIVAVPDRLAFYVMVYDPATMR